jgi:hypothetical protein
MAGFYLVTETRAVINSEETGPSSCHESILVYAHAHASANEGLFLTRWCI